MLEAHTCCDQYSRKHQNLVAYTCGGQNSREHSKMLVAYICGRQMSQRMTSYFPQRVFSHSWGKLTPLRHLHSLKIYLKRPKHQISTYSTKQLVPLVTNCKSGRVSLSKIAQRSLVPSFIQIQQYLGQRQHEKLTSGEPPVNQGLLCKSGEGGFALWGSSAQGSAKKVSSHLLGPLTPPLEPFIESKSLDNG